MLTTTIITLNEEDYIEQAITSVKRISKEIIVVDSGSSDKTVAIAKKLGAKVYTHSFKNYADQKNYALSKSTQPWILSLDADEKISPALAKEINNVLKNPQYVAYSIPRRNIILGKEIHYTRWQSELDRHIWLFKKDSAIWKGSIHEEVFVKKGEIGILKHAKVHYQYKTVTEFVEMMNNYSQIEAEKHISDGKKFSYFQLIAQPLYNFFVRYVYRKGFLDGWRGFVLSYLMAIYHFQLQVKIWELQEK